MVEENVFHISFETKSVPGKIKAVRVEISEELFEADDTSLNIALCDHPLYRTLETYVKSNPSPKAH